MNLRYSLQWPRGWCLTIGMDNAVDCCMISIQSCGQKGFDQTLLCSPNWASTWADVRHWEAAAQAAQCKDLLKGVACFARKPRAPAAAQVHWTFTFNDFRENWVIAFAGANDGFGGSNCEQKLLQKSQWTDFWGRSGGRSQQESSCRRNFFRFLFDFLDLNCALAFLT